MEQTTKRVKWVRNNLYKKKKVFELGSGLKWTCSYFKWAYKNFKRVGNNSKWA